MGFTHAEPYRILDRTEQLGVALATAGLQATAAHANVVTADRDAYLDAAERLGLDTLIIPWAEPAALGDRDGIAATAAAINDAARRAPTGASGSGTTTTTSSSASTPAAGRRTRSW